MKSVFGQVKSLFAQALRKAVPSVPQEVALMPGQPKFGDYQCNNVMGIFRDHGKSLGFASPVALAEAIKEALPPNDMIGDVTIAPTGFINVRLKTSWLTQQLASDIIGAEIEYEDPPRKRVVVDFSSPNIAKEMHVGHLRSTIIGETTCRVLEFCGHEVHRLNHVGDWGTQFGMLIEYMKETYPDFQNELPEVSDLQEFYKASKKRFDDDEDFKKKSQLSVVKLQSGDAFARAAWQKICDVSRKAFQKIYDRLEISLEERGESYYNELIPVLVEELKLREICVESQNAMCIFTPNVVGTTAPLMVVKGDGGYGYDSTDMAAIYHRLFMMRADWVIYVTDMGQESHFFQIFDAAEQAGWHCKPITRCDHMGFGVVQGEDKKKFKTRSGETVKLVDLLDEASERAATAIQNKGSEKEAEINKKLEEGKITKEEAAQQIDDIPLREPKEQAEAGEKLGIAAVRYFDMKQVRVSPYVFNYDRMLDPKGNTAVYLFYAYARIRAIQRNSGVDADSIESSCLNIEHPAERDLALKLLQFPDVIESILSDLHLHKLCDYLWSICNTLTTFYTKCRVLGTESQNSRLLLCEATRKVLSKSFFLLGFTPLERI